MTGRLVWNRDGRDWPNRGASRFVDAGGLKWHVQRLGHGPVALLVHGTGASTHSWRGLAPLLATDFTVIAPDLPGHGFTTSLVTPDLSLPGMARALSPLLHAMQIAPAVAIGHSAGAAVLVRMSLDKMLKVRALIAINGALLPLPGISSPLFSGIARLFATLPIVPSLFALRARSPGAVERLIGGMGSHLDPEGLQYYARLLSDAGHVSGALRMMASWDLKPLERELRGLPVPLTLLAFAGDRAVPAADSVRVAALVPGAVVTTIPDLGHLAHEEDPHRVAALVREAARRAGVLCR